MTCSGYLKIVESIGEINIVISSHQMCVCVGGGKGACFHFLYDGQDMDAYDCHDSGKVKGYYSCFTWGSYLHLCVVFEHTYKCKKFQKEVLMLIFVS